MARPVDTVNTNSLRQILDDAGMNAIEEQVSRPGPEVYAPKKEGESEVSRFFIASGEVIAKALEDQAERLEAIAKDYRRIADEARRTAKVQAETALAHETKLKNMDDLLRGGVK